MSNDIKIKFRELDEKGKHKDTLTKMVERGIGTDDIFNDQSIIRQSYAEEHLSYYWTKAKDYLKTKGFDDDTSGDFCIINGNVTRWNESTGKPIVDARPLWEAIRMRDEMQGQSGEYLAALIDSKCRMVFSTWPPIQKYFSGVLDTVMQIQELFFMFYLREEIHIPYSIGKSCMVGSDVNGKAGSIKRNADRDAVKDELIRLYLLKPKLKELSALAVVTNIHSGVRMFIKKSKMKKDDYSPQTMAGWIRGYRKYQKIACRLAPLGSK